MGVPLFRLVKVTWIDVARDTNPWTAMQTALEMRPLVCHSVGWVLQDQEDFIVLASHMGQTADDDVGGPDAIPKCLIKHIEDLCPVEVA